MSKEERKFNDFMEGFNKIKVDMGKVSFFKTRITAFEWDNAIKRGKEMEVIIKSLLNSA